MEVSNTTTMGDTVPFLGRDVIVHGLAFVAGIGPSGGIALQRNGERFNGR